MIRKPVGSRTRFDITGCDQRHLFGFLINDGAQTLRRKRQLLQQTGFALHDPPPDFINLLLLELIGNRNIVVLVQIHIKDRRVYRNIVVEIQADAHFVEHLTAHDIIAALRIKPRNLDRDLIAALRRISFEFAVKFGCPLAIVLYELGGYAVDAVTRHGRQQLVGLVTARKEQTGRRQERKYGIFHNCNSRFISTRHTVR